MTAREPRAGMWARLSGAALAAGLALVTLAACTTIDGTNAFVDGATFEREVLRSTLQGIGIVEREETDIDPSARAPLVLPGSGAVPPAPQQGNTAALPRNSDAVVIDASGLTDADLAVLRTGRVVDVNQIQGRALTETETRQLAARMAAYRRAQGIGQSRSIYLPPESYFSNVGGQSLICLARDGSLVALTDPSCPPEVRAQLAAQR